jgi:hypothetical protein
MRACRDWLRCFRTAGVSPRQRARQIRRGTVGAIKRLLLGALSVLSSGGLERSLGPTSLGPGAAKVATRAATAVCRLPRSESSGRIRFLEGDVCGPFVSLSSSSSSSSSVLARGPGPDREWADGRSLSACLAELRKEFGYQVESVKKVGAVCVEAAKVDLPTISACSNRKPLSTYIPKDLNDEFNHPEELAAPSDENYENEFQKNIEDVHNSNHGFFATSARDWRHVLRVWGKGVRITLGFRHRGRPHVICRRFLCHEKWRSFEAHLRPSTPKLQRENG